MTGEGDMPDRLSELKTLRLFRWVVSVVCLVVVYAIADHAYGVTGWPAIVIVTLAFGSGQINRALAELGAGHGKG